MSRMSFAIVWVIVAVATMAGYIVTKKNHKIRFLSSAVIGFAAAITTWLAGSHRGPIFGIIGLLIAITLVIHYVFWWKKGAYRVTDIIPFGIAIGMVAFYPLRTSVVRMFEGQTIARWVMDGVIYVLLPTAVATGVIGYMLSNLLIFMARRKGKVGIAGILVAMLTMIVISLEAWTLVKWPAKVSKAAMLPGETVAAETEMATVWAPRRLGTTETEAEAEAEAEARVEYETEAEAEVEYETDVETEAMVDVDADVDAVMLSSTSRGRVAALRPEPTTVVPTTEAPTQPTTAVPTVPAPTEEEEETSYLSFEMYEKPEIPGWITLHNDVLIWDEDPGNDYNFGPSPIEDSEFMELFSEKFPELASSTLQFIVENEEKILENQKLAEWAAGEVDKDFRNRMIENPFTGSAWLAWVDSIIGTRYMGSFYSECHEKWDAAINAAAREFMNDQSLYFRTLTAFFRGYLDHPLTRVELRAAEVMDDQMYLNPFTADGIPDVIVLETKDHKGLFLVYTFVIKGQEFEVPLRIDCGYQPTDVHEIMHIEPLPEPPEPEKLPPEVPTVAPTVPAPTQPTTAAPTVPAPTQPTTEVPTQPTTAAPTVPAPTEAPTQPPAPTKDISKGVQGEPVVPNDNPGPGEYTPPAVIEPSGEGIVEPEVSSKDGAVSGGSSTQGDDYLARMRELESINATQTPAPTPAPAPTSTEAPVVPTVQSVEPTTQAPTPAPTTAAPIHVDDNGAVGNGGAPIDVPTPVQAPAQIATQASADPAAPAPTIDDQPGGDWGNPPD